MGLRPLDPDHWLEPDDQRAAELELKAALVAERPDDVVAVLDRREVVAASAELWEMVRAATGGAVGSSAGATTADVHPIVRCGLATQEDWVLLVPLDGALVLGAACVCFPTRWVLRDKIGLDTAAIHAPVAFYDEQLAAPVDSFVDRLTVDRPVWRLNWNLMDHPALFQPRRPDDGEPGGLEPGGLEPGGLEPGGAEPAPVGERVWLRIERQTLRRLPVTGAVAFSIRVHQRPLSTLADDPDALSRLRSAVGELPAETYEYKGLHHLGDELVTWLDEQLAERPDSSRSEQP